MTPHVLTRRRAEVAGKLARAEAREAEWTCQVCGQPSQAGEPLCTGCGQNRRSERVEGQ